MPNVEEVFRLATQKVRPDPQALERQHARQRRNSRARRAGAFAAAAAVIAITVGVFLALRAGSEADTAPGGGPSPSPFIPTVGVDPQTVEVITLDGATISTLDGFPEDAFALSLSADATKVAFVARPPFITHPPEFDVNQIGTIGADGTGLRLLPTKRVAAASPAWSPDGTKIAFEGTTVEGNTDIYVLNTDGSGLRRLTTDPAVDQFPQWSPDGSTVVYDDSGTQTNQVDPQFSSTAEIMTVPLDGGEPTQLTSDTTDDSSPSWSPDGSQIAYFHGGEIWAVSPDGNNQHRLVKEGGFTPRWSPDGTMIAFTRFSDQSRPIVAMSGDVVDAPLVTVRIVHLADGRQVHLDDVGMATDFNTPQWFPTGDALLIRRVQF